LLAIVKHIDGYRLRGDGTCRTGFDMLQFSGFQEAAERCAECGHLITELVIHNYSLCWICCSFRLQISFVELWK